MVIKTRLLFSFLLLVAQGLSAATLTSHVDRRSLLMGEHVAFTLSLKDSDTRLRAEGLNPNVDLTLLTPDFELGVPGSQHRFNIYRNRGRSTSEITLALFPRHTGRLTIPPFKVDGLTSQSIRIDVRPKSLDKTPPAFVRASVSQAKPWVREPTLVYLDLYHRIDLKEAKLGGELDVKGLSALVSKLPATELSETINQQHYNVSRTTWVITPLSQQAISLTLPDIWLQFSDGKKQRLPFTTVDITPKALPGLIDENTIIGKPELTQTLFNQPLSMGKLVPWTLTLTAPVNQHALPETLDIPPLPIDIKLYRDVAHFTQSNDQQILETEANYPFFIMPLSAGTFTTPTITLPYFDTMKGTLNSITLAAQTFTVVAASINKTPTMATPTSTQGLLTSPSIQTDPQDGFWKMISAILLFVWLVTLIIWQYHRSPSKKPVHNRQSPATQNDRHPLKTKLLITLGSHTLQQGLDQWIKQCGENPEITQAITALQEMCYGKNTREETNALKQQVENTIQIISTSHYQAVNQPDAAKPTLDKQTRDNKDPLLPQSFMPSNNGPNHKKDHDSAQ